MKTQSASSLLAWKDSLSRWQAISARASRFGKQHRNARQRLAHQLLMKAGVGDALCAYNWGADSQGERGMLCQRALALLDDWRGSEFADRVQAMAWNRYMVPHGTPTSEVRPYRPKTPPCYVRAA